MKKSGRSMARLGNGLLVLALVVTLVPLTAMPALAASPGDIVVNEIMQNPAAVSDSAGEWFELYNTTAGDIDINGWTIRDNDFDDHLIDNGGPLIIAAGGYLVLGNNTDSATNGGVTVDYGYGSNWFLSNTADEVIVLDESLVEINRVEYDGGPEFPDPTGASMSLIDPALDNNIGANWCTASTPFGDGDLGTPGAANDCAAPTIEVVINEIIQNPAAVSDSAGEWFELHNPMGSDIDIDGWTIQDNDTDNHLINNGGPLVIPAGGYLVLGINADSATNGGVNVDYQYETFFLANGADEVVLLDGGLNEIDRVEYDGGPEFPDPTGASMALRDPALDNNVGANWCVSGTPYGDGDLGSPGGANDCAVPFVPIYDIQYTTDPSGDSPYNGQTVTTQGVVTAVFYGGDRVWIQDGAGAWNGLYLYSPDTAPSVGDLVEVTGPIEEYYNLTELNGGALTVLSSGHALPAPSVVSTFDVNAEQWESVFVRVENVTVTDPDLGNGEWQVNDGTGPVVVDDMGEYTYVPALDDALDYVQGPLNYSFSAFKIEPRDDGDIGMPLGYTPIYDIQYTMDPSGDSPYEGQIVTTRGVVTAVFYGGDRVWIQDGAGAWNGLYLYSPDTAPSVGDLVEVTGPIEEYYNLTELNGGALTILSSGNSLPAPSVVSTFDVNAEQWESVFVRVEDVTVTDPDLGNGEWQVDDGTGPVVVDDMGEYTYVPALDDVLDYVQGPLNYSFSAFKIEPRDDGDIGMPLGYTPIYDIQYTTDPSGDSPYEGQTVTTQGVVTAVFYDGDRVWIQDGEGAWNGLYLYSPDTAPSLGDLVEVTGPIEEYYNLTELNGGALTILSSGNSLPAPSVVGTFDVNEEQWESVFVRVENVTVTDPDLGNGEWQVNDGSGPVVVDDMGIYTYVPLQDDVLDYVQGPLNYSFSAFKIEPRDDGDIGAPEVCGDPYTGIYDVQGDGYISPLKDQIVSVEGIVTGDFQESDELDGFFIQDPDGDANPATSDGVWVYAPGAMDVAVGEAVRVRGLVDEYYTLTEIKDLELLLSCATGTVGATPVELPVPVDLEPYEGMLVTFPEELTAAQNYFQGRYGQVTMSSDGRLFNPTNTYLPSSPEAIAMAEDNMRRMFVLDDGTTDQNPYPIPYIGAENTLRAGDTIVGLTGLVDYGPINSSFPPARYYRLQPAGPVEFTRANERTDAPEEVGGIIRIASFNVLNYFNGDGMGGGFPTSRGADSLEEFIRQRDKIIPAIMAMDADVIGLMEIENDGYNEYSAIQDLVNGLNDAAGAGTYAFIDPTIDMGSVGTDEIAVGFIYRPATVSPVGSAAVIDSSVDPDFNSDYNRPAIAQTFERSTGGGRFTAAVNHLKSKGSPCDAIGDPDTGDGQGNCNLTRKYAAEALAEWLATDPTGSGDPDFFIIGDLNAYAMEDPITALKDAGYINLVQAYNGLYTYSYTFDGQAGYLDHSLASPAATSLVFGTTIWHINTDEPSVIDYNVEYKSEDLYTPTPFRSSDHDPVIVGFCEANPPEVEVTVTPDTLWAPNHKYEIVEATVEVWDDRDPNPTLTLVSVESSEPDNDKGDGNKANDIVIEDDFTFKLRAERSGTGEGRVYTITYMATDSCGNSTVATATVTVAHDQGKKGK